MILRDVNALCVIELSLETTLQRLKQHSNVICDSPMNLKTRQKSSVIKTKAVSHWWLSMTVEMPRYMKIIVSQTDASIFMKYLTVVCDFCDMFFSTYRFIDIPQNVQLPTGKTILCKHAHLSNTYCVNITQQS